MSNIEFFERKIHPTDSNRHLDASRLRSFYETLATQLFQEFEPTKKVSPRVSRDFMLRLDNWLDGFTDTEDKWIAFKSLEYFLFAGINEFEELYRYAFEHKIKHWVVDQAQIDIFSANVDQQLSEELEHVWPCPVTDSLRINGFLHITGLKGKGLRPDWYSLKTLGSSEKIKSYIDNEDIKYLVLLEDFSGSGGQISRTIRFACENFTGPILLIPLIICSKGDKTIREKLTTLPNNIYYDPVVVIPNNCLVTPQPSLGEPPLFGLLRPVMKKGYDAMAHELDGEEYGWKKTGSLITMYSNCPNNTPPIYYNNTPTWNPLFPRSDREVK
ncbi:MAG: hypothetical protein JXR18_05585 [Neptuniibacter sp.]